jgi:hypothetical protein
MNSLFEIKRFAVFAFYGQYPGPAEDADDMTGSGSRFDAAGAEKPNPVHIQPLWMNLVV